MLFRQWRLTVNPSPLVLLVPVSWRVSMFKRGWFIPIRCICTLGCSEAGLVSCHGSTTVTSSCYYLRITALDRRHTIFTSAPFTHLCRITTVSSPDNWQITALTALRTHIRMSHQRHFPPQISNLCRDFHFRRMSVLGLTPHSHSM